MQGEREREREREREHSSGASVWARAALFASLWKRPSACIIISSSSVLVQSFAGRFGEMVQFSAKFTKASGASLEHDHYVSDDRAPQSASARASCRAFPKLIFSPLMDAAISRGRKWNAMNGTGHFKCHRSLLETRHTRSFSGHC